MRHIFDIRDRSLTNTPMGYIIYIRDRETEVYRNDIMECRCGEKKCCNCSYKKKPRSADTNKLLKNRLNRISGQIGGIMNMIDDGRYCGDILTQVAAVESALESFAYVILKEHMQTCVADKIKDGDTEIIEETLELMRKLK